MSDDPSLVNLTFEYASGPELSGTVELGDFTFESIYGTTGPGQFAGEDLNEITGSTEVSQGIVPLPVVPEPSLGILAALSGGAMRISRCFRTSARRASIMPH